MKWLLLRNLNYEEQVVRILYMLGLTYFVMRIVSGGYVLAVAHSTFAAFVGAVIAFLYLAYKDVPRP